MAIVITGADGFVGRNLAVHLTERKLDFVRVTRETSSAELAKSLSDATFVFHLAGVNRPRDTSEFATGNAGFTHELCDAIRKTRRQIPIVYTSSSQASLENPYGLSKADAEKALISLSNETGSPVFIYRLPNIFGKWSRPNYNSAVATFCHNTANGLPLRIDNPDASLTLVYVDDVVSAFLDQLRDSRAGVHYCQADPTYTLTVAQLAERIGALRASRESGITENVGDGLMRALNATYLSFLKPQQFSYPLVQHSDPRGRFVEMLKTRDAGQFSFFTAHPGVTRGSHYHHSKTEKFLVVKGTARFGFRHLLTNEKFELVTDAAKPEVVETIPGWTHDITNVGTDEMVVMLWASEIFDRDRPDTVAQKV